ncbi:MAG: Probable metallo-hydrolase YflN [uncultured Solirubrobacteraceae bacterium]|uniref:Probable metallo-hydrolase YflN n=1 Tax=uncultured Solirubrobacteraceae bacterium TaxID=1162706 RepID=A0A6J4TNB3_9ACTN|nr:MAG: Probable metallo-hydrolase YflN [uncultured Solirubrobacteraceae bacterium]
MRTLAQDVHQLAGRPPNAINVYLVGDVLVDAGTPAAERRILGQLAGRDVRAHLVTHAHADHFGSSHAICEALGIALWAGATDADDIEQATPKLPAKGIGLVLMKSKPPPAHPVARRLREGDEIGHGFVVLDAPGHTLGHISLWRESDRTLIVADAFFNIRRPAAPPDFLTIDPELNRASMRRLAELRPALTLFGHGAPLRDPEQLKRAVARAGGS